MTKPPSRNAPCPCGSQKKYKRCCGLASSKSKAPKELSQDRREAFAKYLRDHDSRHVLNLIIGMQLLPQNHGKNIRIEIIALQALKYLGSGADGDLGHLQDLIRQSFPFHHEEDPPGELFTEGVVYQGGNAVVFPGINTHSVDRFRKRFEAILFAPNSLPPDFKNKVSDGIALLLILGQILARPTPLVRNMREEAENNELYFPSRHRQFQIPADRLSRLCRRFGIDLRIVAEFTSTTDVNEEYDAENHTLLHRPLVLFESDYYFLLPTAQMSALIAFVDRAATQFGCATELKEVCSNYVWHSLQMSLFNMHWFESDFQLLTADPQLDIMEGLFDFGIQMVAYVIYLPQGAEPDRLNHRMKEVVTDFKSKSSPYHHVLTLILFDEPSILLVEEPQSQELRLNFSCHDFMTLVNAGEWGAMDLWTFAKSYHEHDEMFRSPLTSTTDVYAVYKRHRNTFYLEDDHQYDFVNALGAGYDLIQKAKQRRDHHGARSTSNGSEGYRPVVRYRDYAPIYKPQLPTSGLYQLLLEGYRFPIWIINDQVGDDQRLEAFVENMADAIALWLHRLQPLLASTLSNAPLNHLNIKLVFDEEDFQPVNSQEILKIELESLVFSSAFDTYCMSFLLPRGFQRLLTGGNNAGERRIMRELLVALNTVPGIRLDEVSIDTALDQVIPLGPAKMILLIDSGRDVQTDNRWLHRTVSVHDGEVDLIVDSIPSIIAEPIPEEVVDKKAKVELLNKIVTSLWSELKRRSDTYDQETLVCRLLEMNEGLVFRREFGRIKTSAEIHCFGKDPDTLTAILDQRNELTHTSLATRCLIEFLIQNPASGSAKPSDGVVQELLAYMNEVINYGATSDSIHLGMTNPKMGILGSGRLGIDKSYEEKLKDYARDRELLTIDHALDLFTGSFELSESIGAADDRADMTLDALDQAFMTDWNVPYISITALCHILSIQAETMGRSVVCLTEIEFQDLLSQLRNDPTFNWNAVASRLMLSRDSLATTTGDIRTGPEHFPWRYNRECSLSRRPIVVLDTSQGKRYLFGLRQAEASSRYIHHMVNDARFKGGGTAISRILGTFNSLNGKLYRNQVKQWFKDNSPYVVIDHEVKISPNGHLEAENNLGDVDVLLFNSSTKIVYSIECKNTADARNIYEMKLSLDSYFGRGSKAGMIAKHEARHEWLINNTDKLVNVLNVDPPFSIVSVVLTMNVVPAAYVSERAPGLPILNFRTLKIKGLDYLSEPT